MTSHVYGARTAGLLPDQCVSSGRVPKARAEHTSIAIASRSVLIVEDHPLVGEAMRDVLARSADDLDPHLCPDAATAIAHLLDSQKTWFRIFLDLDVPGANGLSLAKQICELKLQSRCCIVSGLDRPHLIDEVRRLGFLGYIVKAIPLTDFARALGRALGRPSLVPTPAFAMRLLLGEMADALLLTGQKVLPTTAEEAAYRFQHPMLGEALDSILK